MTDLKCQGIFSFQQQDYVSLSNSYACRDSRVHKFSFILLMVTIWICSHQMFLICNTYMFVNYTFLAFQVAAYDTVERRMAFFDPSRAKDFLFISGTKVNINSVLRCFFTGAT